MLRDRPPLGRRAAIVASATRLFCQLPYRSVTVDAIAFCAHASIGSVYHHFEGKAHIASAVLEEIARSHLLALRTAVELAPGAEEGTRELVAAHHRWVRRHPAEASLLLGAGLPASRPVTPLGDPAADAPEIGRWLAGHVGRHAIVSMDVASCLAVALGPALELSRRHLATTPGTGPGPSVRALLAEAAWRALGARTPSPRVGAARAV